LVGLERTKLPMVLADDRDAVRAAVTMCGAQAGHVRLAWIQDTLHTEVLGLSPALLAKTDGVELVREPAPLPFDDSGRLHPLNY
jgi:hypothetical protein